jgi:two-component system OmpR family response regulator
MNQSQRSYLQSTDVSNSMAKVLIVEDDKDIVLTIEDALLADNYTVEAVYTGPDGLDRLKYYEFDLVVLDWDLPGMSGVEILREIRAQGKRVPILMLTGKNASREKQQGLDSGADDYLTKPFDLGELRARLRALLRRSSGSPTSVLKVGTIELDPINVRVTKSGAEIRLLPREFALLEFLMRHPGQVFSADALLNHVWHSSSDSSPEAFRMCLARLRKKIDTGTGESAIQTVHGMGYKLSI